MTDEQARWINEASLEELLRKWRFAPVGDAMLQGDSGDHFCRVMKQKRNEVSAEEWSRISKAVGWEK